MIRNEKIIVFNGPKDEFDKYITQYYDSENCNYNLTKLVNLSDMERKTLLVKIPGYSESNSEELKVIDLLTVSMNEYSGVTEAVTSNFVNFVSNFNINRMIIQNPPNELINDLFRQYNDTEIHIHNHEYKKINPKIIRDFNEQSNKIILGQEKALQKITQSLIIQQKLNKDDKPIVIMLYGPSGVGKTETGRFLANIMGEKMFYNQFSMFQNEGYFNYLYGDKVQSPSFAKDLLNRTSNIIFLDEFDKANHFVYSAMYELFDTGIFEDNNFRVNLKNTLIICTSNYDNPKQILEHLGAPMFFRLNCCIKYDALSIDVIKQLIEKYYNSLIGQLSESEVNIVEMAKIKEKYMDMAKQLNNARQIENFIRNDIAKELIKNLC